MSALQCNPVLLWSTALKGKCTIGITWSKSIVLYGACQLPYSQIHSQPLLKRKLQFSVKPWLPGQIHRGIHFVVTWPISCLQQSTKALQVTGSTLENRACTRLTFRKYRASGVVNGPSKHLSLRLRCVGGPSNPLSSVFPNRVVWYRLYLYRKASQLQWLSRHIFPRTDLVVLLLMNLMCFLFSFLIYIPIFSFYLFLVIRFYSFRLIKY